MLGELANVGERLVLWIFDVHAYDVLVVLALVDHWHQADGTHLQEAHGLDGFLHQHYNVQRVVVVGQRLRYEAVILRVDHGRVQDPVYLQESGVLIKLVFDLRAFGDLDQDAEFVRSVFAYGNVVPRMGHGDPFRPSLSGLRSRILRTRRYPSNPSPRSARRTGRDPAR